MVVAIDGPAGVGKSTLALAIAESLGYFYLNTGNFYRAVTRESQKKGLSLSDERAFIEIAQKARFEISEGGRLSFNGEDVQDLLHTAEIDQLVAQVSAIVELRTLINQKIRGLSQSANLVVEGRDMTTVVFPQAEVRLYLDASAEVRARRRFDQRPEGQRYEDILNAIEARDKIDREKKVGGLKLAPGALYLDTSYLTIQQVCEKVYGIIREKIKPQE